jgi:hypothetical protein
MLGQNHAAELNWHVLTFLHPIFICQDTYWAQVAVALTRFRTSHSDKCTCPFLVYACIILQMSLTCWVKLEPKFYAQILHQCLVSSSWSEQTKLDQCEHPNKRVKTQDYPLAQILHIACMQIIKSFCPDSPIQSESQPIQLRWFHFVWTRSSRHTMLLLLLLLLHLLSFFLLLLCLQVKRLGLRIICTSDDGYSSGS